MIDGLTTTRAWAALLLLALYLLLVAHTVWRVWRARRQLQSAAVALKAAMSGANTWVIGYASQTGTAQQFAWQSAQTLHAAGLSASFVNMAQLDTATLQMASRALFIVSTYGEGDPPDDGTVFSRRVMSGDCRLSDLHYGVLALGDRQYRNFCGFGLALDNWLRAHGATPLFNPITVHNSDPSALTEWRHELSHVAGTDDLPDWQAPQFDQWRLSARHRLNEGSAGEPIFQLDFVPVTGVLPDWQSGDLAQIEVPAEPERPRDYSVASMPDDGALQLLVRLERRPDGNPGKCSSWLYTELAIGGPVRMRLRAHENFRLGANHERPLILVGNGTGIAGLRAHLHSRRHTATRNWLIFGERNAVYDGLYAGELAEHRASGLLTRVDLAFSRDQPERRYVQHCLRAEAALVREWISDGAAIYVCGSLEGMASGVEAALNEILGADEVQALTIAGRYRRDVY